MRSGEISPAFRERLMMVVTEVNGCRYCSAYHSALSVRAGVSTDELRTLLGGEIPQDSPAEELPALAYAQHWAQNDARPEPDAHRGLVETYGEEKAAMIDLILRMIRAGNLAGNSWDWFLDRISFGRLGQTSRDRRASDFTPAG
jgi:AhpD family alkylhydroperoxidase